MTTRNVWRRLMVAVSAGALLLATQASIGTRPTVAARAAIPNGGTAAIPITADPTFDMWSPNAYTESVFVNRVLFDGLTKPGINGVPAPDLATKWKSAKNGLNWTFTLRKGVTWHDGKPFTSADVSYTFNDVVLNKALGSPDAPNFAAVKNVTTPNAYTAVFHLSRPFAALPAYLSYNAGILPEHVLKGQQNPFKDTNFDKGHPIGTGPFQMGTYVSGQSVTLVPYKHYFGGAPHLSSLVFKVVADPNAQLAQALSGDLTAQILSDTTGIARLKSDPNLKIRAVPVPQFYWLSLHATNPLFSSVKVRQAVEYAIDRKAMIKNLLNGYGTVANGPIAPALKYYYDAKTLSYSYDPKKAVQLLKQAGWTKGSDGILTKNGKKFSFTLTVGQQGALVPAGQLIQSYLKKIGMDVSLNIMEWNAMIQKVIVQRNYDATIAWWIYAPDPDMYPYLDSTAAKTGDNIPDFKSKTLDSLLVKGETASTPAKRRVIYDQLQQESAKLLPYNFLWYPKEVQVLDKNLHGLPKIGLRDAMNYTNKWYMTK